MLGKTRHEAGSLELVGFSRTSSVVPEAPHAARSEHLCQLPEGIGLARHIDIVAVPVGLPCPGEKNDQGKTRRRIGIERSLLRTGNVSVAGRVPPSTGRSMDISPEAMPQFPSAHRMSRSMRVPGPCRLCLPFECRPWDKGAREVPGKSELFVGAHRIEHKAEPACIDGISVNGI